MCVFVSITTAFGRNESRVSCAVAGFRQSRHGYWTNIKSLDLLRFVPYGRKDIASKAVYIVREDCEAIEPTET